MIKCESCGASFDELEPVCPYCGALNYIGANAQYHQKLDNIKEDLSKIPEQQKAEYVDAAKTTTKRTLKYLFIAIAIVAILGAIVMYFMNRDSYNYKDIMDWQNENYPIVNEMYEQGDYEGIMEFISNISTSDIYKGYHLYDWEHYPFISCYQSFIFADAAIEEYDTVGLMDGDLGYLIYICLEGKFFLEETNFTQEEYDIIVFKYDRLREFLVNTIGISEETIDDLYEESNMEEFVSLSPSIEYGEEVEGEYQ